MLIVYAMPRLKFFVEKAVEDIADRRLDRILLPLPKSSERILREHIQCNNSFSEFLRDLLKYMKLDLVYSKRYYYLEPLYSLLKTILSIREVDIVCYKTLGNELTEIEFCEKIVLLTARTLITEKINVEAWREALISKDEKVIEDKCQRILEYSAEETVALVEYSARRLLNCLKKHSAVIVKPKDYVPLPLEVLVACGELLNNNDLVFLIRMHLDFIKNYLYRCKDYEEAYFRWLNRISEKNKEYILKLYRI
ncbi:MAG: hypothetical protein DRJ63_04555 [Thermoprotei archaeon]|nr:MAG: hypothetical protein DRJ63_04555 [Thermoprotei archaeon]